jgi:cytochrome c553
MNAIAQRFRPRLGGITLAFALAPPAPSCATGLAAACFSWFQRVGRLARPRGIRTMALEQLHSNNGSVNMINNQVSTVFGVLVVLAALGAPANAAEASAHPSSPAEFAAKLLVCNACHGDKGTPKNATIPVIWGQQENYLGKQLHDFQSGTRNFEVMSWMTINLTPEELTTAAANFAKRSWPARSAGAAATSPPAMVAVCTVCHQQNFVGGLPAPRLAGQSYEYLVEAMRRYADGERTNNAEMRTIMQAISPADREAIARYISNL